MLLAFWKKLALLPPSWAAFTLVTPEPLPLRLVAVRVPPTVMVVPDCEAIELVILFALASNITRLPAVWAAPEEILPPTGQVWKAEPLPVPVLIKHRPLLPAWPPTSNCTNWPLPLNVLPCRVTL